MVVLHRAMWLIAGLSGVMWLAFRIIWPFAMLVVIEVVIVSRVFNGVEILALIISIVLFLGMLILAISMFADWTWSRLKKEWKKAWQWDAKT